jgi:hypothetical protein
MPRTEIGSIQIRDQSVGRDDLNTTTSGQALVRKLIANAGIILANTGVDAGTGDVTITVNSAYIATLTANDSSYAFGKTEGSLNVNTALTANNSTNLGGVSSSFFVKSFRKLDSITSAFNGAQTVFTTAVSSIQVTPAGAEYLFVSLDGIWQEPAVAFSVSGNTIIFTTPPTADTRFFATIAR